MNLQFCTECGSELDPNGKCTNSACIMNAEVHFEPLDEDKHAGKQSMPGADAARKSADAAAASVKKTFEEYTKDFKASVEKEKGMLIVPDCVDPDRNEVPIKQYDIARLQSLLKGSFAEGRLQVTNKRILFRANGIALNGPTTMQTEMSLEEVGGIEIRKEPRFNFVVTIGLMLIYLFLKSLEQPVFGNLYRNEVAGAFMSMLIAAISVLAFLFLREKRMLRYIAMSALLAALPIHARNFTGIPSAMILLVGSLFAISFLHNAFARNLVVRILTKGGNAAAEVRRKDGFFSFQHNEYTGFSQVLPGPDVDLAIKELGAVIRAVQHGQIS